MRIQRCVASLCLTAALGAPAVIVAASPAVPAAQEDRGVYDREHKDYHHWDDHENGAWHRFLEENHRKDHEFAKSKRKEQEEYWAWRHNHPD
jgi:hypothetical protein